MATAKECSVVDCSRISRTRTWCGMHYARWLKNGDVGGSERLRTGVKKHWLYSTFNNMRTRCYNPKAKAFHRYGGRGIRICPQWLESPWLFFSYVEEELGFRPEKHQLDRIDNDGDYEPGNLRWATGTQNMANSGGQHRLSSPSKYKGIWFDKRRNHWMANIRIKRRTIHLGRAKTEEEAARKYDAAAHLLFGEFARPNFLEC